MPENTDRPVGDGDTRSPDATSAGLRDRCCGLRCRASASACGCDDDLETGRTTRTNNRPTVRHSRRSRADVAALVISGRSHDGQSGVNADVPSAIVVYRSNEEAGRGASTARPPSAPSPRFRHLHHRRS